MYKNGRLCMIWSMEKRNCNVFCEWGALLFCWIRVLRVRVVHRGSEALAVGPVTHPLPASVGQGEPILTGSAALGLALLVTEVCPLVGVSNCVGELVVGVSHLEYEKKCPCNYPAGPEFLSPGFFPWFICHFL